MLSLPLGVVLIALSPLLILGFFVWGVKRLLFGEDNVFAPETTFYTPKTLFTPILLFVGIPASFLLQMISNDEHPRIPTFEFADGMGTLATVVTLTERKRGRFSKSRKKI